MTSRRKSCADMAEVRESIDAIDRELVAILADRLHFIAEAARIKPNRDQVRDDERVEDVLNKVRAAAKEQGVDPELIAGVFRELVERSIVHEFTLFDQRKH
ncbi:MAG: chorismate mutase [Rhodospirillaceae bacterium]|nr:MAG: chorismate mutase [Rhodospirillaceae bacterium]